MPSQKPTEPPRIIGTNTNSWVWLKIKPPGASRRFWYPCFHFFLPDPTHGWDLLNSPPPIRQLHRPRLDSSHRPKAWAHLSEQRRKSTASWRSRETASSSAGIESAKRALQKARGSERHKETNWKNQEKVLVYRNLAGEKETYSFPETSRQVKARQHDMCKCQDFFMVQDRRGAKPQPLDTCRALRFSLVGFLKGYKKGASSGATTKHSTCSPCNIGSFK